MDKTFKIIIKDAENIDKYKLQDLLEEYLHNLYMDGELENEKQFIVEEVSE
jgi:hypothetical protein